MESRYLLDDKKVEWTVLINQAKRLDKAFKDGFVKTTSRAAEILRDHGHAVEREMK